MINITRIEVDMEHYFVMFEDQHIENGMLIIGKLKDNNIIPFRCNNTFIKKSPINISKECQDDIQKRYNINLEEYFNITLR